MLNLLINAGRKGWAYFICSALLSCHFIVCAQNILSNPSFEVLDDLDEAKDHAECAFLFEEKYSRVSHWYAIATVDYMSVGSLYYRFLERDKIQPHTGRSAVGFLLQQVDDKQAIQEYLYQKIASIAYDSVLVSMYISFSSTTAHYAHSIDILFTNENPCEYGVDRIKGAMYSIPIDPSIHKEGIWSHIEKTIRIENPYQYVVFGNFLKKKATRKKNTKHRYAGAYIYMDDVSIVPLKKNAQARMQADTIAFASQGGTRPNKTISQIDLPSMDTLPTPLEKYKAIPAVFFEKDSDTLSVTQKRLLNIALTALRKSDCPILISGHTDYTGSYQRNLSLSQKRAETVMNYLITSGISPIRLTINYFADSKPAALGHDEASKAFNRRVDVKLLCQ